MRPSQTLPIPAGPRDIAGMGASNTSFEPVVRAFVYALLFVGAMELVISFARYGQNVTPVWLASAILAWALVVSPVREWIMIAAFATAAHVIRALVVGDKPATELIYLFANVGGPLACAAMMRIQQITLDFEDRSSVIRFLLVCGVAAPAISTGVVAIGAPIDPSRFDIADLGAWFLSDALSYVVFLPVFKSLSSGGWRDLMAPAMQARTLSLFAVLIAALALLWVMPMNLELPFYFLLIPFLVFLVFELGVTGARAAVIVATVGLMMHALLTSQTDNLGMSPDSYIFSMQIYIAAIAACILPLAAALGEKQRLYESVSDALGDAQSAWADLIAAEAHYRLVADNSRDMVMRIGLDGSVIFASPACRLLSADVQGLDGRSLASLAHPDDSARVGGQIAAFVKADMLDLPETIRARLKLASGGWQAFDIVVTLIASRGRDAEEIIAVLREVQA